MNKWLKRIGIGFGGLVALLLIAVGTIYGLAERRFRRTYDITPAAVAVARDSATVARGEHVVKAIGKCVDCHGPDLAGTVMVDDPAFGRLVAPNLTRGAGGAGATFSDADFVRAIRHGVSKDGRPLIVMPSKHYSAFSDADMGAIVAYLRTVPPVDREQPATFMSIIPRVLLATQVMEGAIAAEVIPHTTLKPSTVPPGPTREYGAYLARVGGCMGCHGEGLSGGPEPGGPPGINPSNITPAGIGHWKEADFFRALRTGRRPDGSMIKPEMPWKQAGLMTDDEIRAVWAYLQTVPARPYGNR